MTIYDYDKRENACPVCRQARLIFIVTAPNLWPVGDTVRYRCKACATAEAEAGGDPLTVFQHGERRGLQEAWRRDRLGEVPAHLKPHVEERRKARNRSNPGASDAKAVPEAIRTQKARRIAIVEG